MRHMDQWQGDFIDRDVYVRDRVQSQCARVKHGFLCGSPHAYDHRGNLPERDRALGARW
jgi:hypothetical protein|eukprot:COSAG02_NODE_723_length_18041_cov_7.464720_16_plen_59_part_00